MPSFHLARLALIKTELRLALRSSRLYQAAAVSLVLAGLAGWLGLVEHQARDRLFVQVTDFGAAAFSNQRADHPHNIAHNGYVVARPAAPLGFLDAGLDRIEGRWLRLDAHQTRALEGARVSELVRGPGGGRFDLGLWLSTLAPILVVLLVFDQVAGERARGTWPMLRAAGVRPLAWAFAKLVGAIVRILLGVYLPSVFVAVLIIGLGGPLDPWRDLAWLVLHALGLLAWGALGLLISTLSPSPRAALLAGTAVWALLALFVPPTASGLARWLEEEPPPGEVMVRAAAFAESAHARTEALEAKARADIRRRHPDWNGEGTPPEVLDAVMLRLGDAEAAEQSRALFESLDARQDAEERWVAKLGLISPTGLTSLASSAIAGSDLAHLRSVFDHYETYRQNLMAWFNRWWAEKGRGGFEAMDTERSLDELDSAPRPAAPTFPVGLAFERARLPFALLLGLTALLLAVFGWAFARRLEAAG